MLIILIFIFKNELYLCPAKDTSYLISDAALITDINWIKKIADQDIQVKFRYRQADQEVHLKHLDDGNILLTYSQGIKAVTPGQQAVFYDHGELLGGGVIDDVYVNNESVALRLKEQLKKHGR